MQTTDGPTHHFNRNALTQTFITQSQLLINPVHSTFRNILGRGKHAGNQQFSLFPQCFLLYQRQKLSFDSHSICHLLMLLIWTC